MLHVPLETHLTPTAALAGGLCVRRIGLRPEHEQPLWRCDAKRLQGSEERYEGVSLRRLMRAMFQLRRAGIPETVGAATAAPRFCAIPSAEDRDPGVRRRGALEKKDSRSFIRYMRTPRVPWRADGVLGQESD